MRPTQLEYSVASAAIRGARPYQEDSTKVWSRDCGGTPSEGASTVLAVLADGMGGHVSGEIASGIACTEYVEHFGARSGEPESRLIEAVAASNLSIQRAIQADAKLNGMGCTIVAAFLDADGLRWASVGDSSLLLFRNNQLIRLNEDHSLGALLDKQARSNVISREEALNSPNRRSLRSALTGGVIAQTDVQKSPQRLIAGDWVLLASDGLETLSGDEIATITAAYHDAPPHELAEVLLQEVEQRKIRNQDNTSVVAIRVQDTPKTLRIGARGNAADGNGIHSADTEVLPVLRRGELIGTVIAEPNRARTRLLRPPRRSHSMLKWTLVLGFGLCLAGFAAWAV